VVASGQRALAKALMEMREHGVGRVLRKERLRGHTATAQKLASTQVTHPSADLPAVIRSMDRMKFSIASSCSGNGW
jgi:hypothetical protein